MPVIPIDSAGVYRLRWAGPAFLFVVWGAPIFIVLAASFLELNVSDPQSYYRTVGFRHYVGVVTSSTFWFAIFRTLKLTLLVVTASAVCGIVIGWALLGVNRRLARFLLALVITPLFLPPVISALMWYFQFNPHYGPLGYAVHALTKVTLLGTDTAFYAVAGIECWRLVPFFALIVFVCGRSLENSLNDTLAIYQRGNSWATVLLLARRFSPTLSVAFFLGIALAMRSFESIFITTGGGPGAVTETFPILVHRTSFQRFELGLAASQSVLYDLLIAVFLGRLWRVVHRADA